jgi:hypothetical protein
MHAQLVASKVHVGTADAGQYRPGQHVAGPSCGTGMSRITSGSQNFSRTIALLVFGRLDILRPSFISNFKFLVKNMIAFFSQPDHIFFKYSQGLLGFGQRKQADREEDVFFIKIVGRVGGL